MFSFSLAGLIVLVAFVAIWFAARQMHRARIRKAARGILATAERSAAPLVVGRVPEARTAFPEADHEYYGQAQAELETLGFHVLGDIEIVSARAICPSLHTFLRMVSNDDGTPCADVFSVRKGTGPGADVEFTRVVEFTDLLSDGASITTCPKIAASALDHHPLDFRFYVPAETSIAERLALHEEHVRAVLLKRPGAGRVPRRTLEQLLASMYRLSERRVKYRHEIGLITFEELRRMAPNVDTRLIRVIFAEVQRLRAEQSLASSENER